ncbi:MAG: OmpA family protein [Candidatus Thiodiazotropha sp.]
MLKSIQYKMLLEENSFLRITGYADAQGDMDYNYLLSLKRAKEVKKFFLLRGIDGDRLQVGAVGSVGGRGLESGQTGREIRSGKRRVEVILFPK